VLPWAETTFIDQREIINLPLRGEKTIRLMVGGGNIRATKVKKMRIRFLNSLLKYIQGK